MSKLWIVHRNPRRRQALARLSGLAAPDLVSGAPEAAAFAGASAPAAILLGVEGDFELELDFLHRTRDRLDGTRRLLLTTPRDVDEVQRLFGAAPDEILDALPSDRSLRALVLAAVAHRNAETLAERRDRERIASRFAGWFGELEVPGLLRALDPSLAELPLLVRGVPGSGRGLLARYVELVRGMAGTTLRIDAREISDIDVLVQRLRTRRQSERAAARTVWIDDIDALPIGVQHALTEWIRLGTAPASAAMESELRWIATARAADLRDDLDPELEHAFAPLTLTVPTLTDHPERLRPFAEQIAADWSAMVGGPPRTIAESAIGALEGIAWSGDRGAVEALLRSTLAATAKDPIEDSDLVDALPTGDPLPIERARGSVSSSPLEEAPIDEAPIEEASFVDDDLGRGTRVETPSESSDGNLAEFERAFLEGLPTQEAPPGRGANPPAATLDPELPPARDVSAQLSEESFQITDDKAARESGLIGGGGGGNDRPPNDEPDAQAASQNWRRLARSLSHEIRNPLVSIRTFAELLPEHFSDESFRERFTELVGRDVAHIEEVVARLASATEREKFESAPVDVSSMLERLLDERREEIGRDRLLVLRELERDAPIAWADPHALEVALAGLLDRALASLPERGDLFVATRRIERAADGRPRLRILLRHHNPELGGADAGGLEEVGSAANVLEYVLAETVVEASGGTLTIDTTDAQEALILVDLLTPA